MGSIEGAQPAHGGTRSSIGGEAQPAHMVAPRHAAASHAPRPAFAHRPGRGNGAEPHALVAIAAVLAFALVVALGIMVAISFFDHSYADDWHYGVDAHLALEAGRGVFGAVAAAAQEVVDTYFSWQGTYSAIFLMALQPGVFAEELYGLGAVFIIVALVLATAYASSVVVRDLLGAPPAVWVALTCLVLLLQTQLLPSPVEGFWWYNSAIYYTFYHALMLVAAALSVRIVRGRTRRGPIGRAGLVGRAMGLTLLTAILAGGNFVTGLVAGTALFAATVACIARGNRRGFALVPALVVFAAGFALSMAAPGNVERQVSQFPGDNLGVFMTLLRSAFAGVEYIVLWTNGLFVLALALAVPVMVWAARRSACSFALPGVPAVASVLLFMASFAPTFYSMGTVGPGRVQNIRYDLFVVLAFLCIGWFCGWCVRRLERSGRTAAVPWKRLGRVWPAYTALMFAVLAPMVGALAIDERHRDDLVSISAASSLISGEAQEYDDQVWARITTLTESPSADIQVPFYTVGPKVLFMGDIRDNMDNYINFRLAQWYGRDSVIGYTPSSSEE